MAVQYVLAASLISAQLDFLCPGLTLPSDINYPTRTAAVTHRSMWFRQFFSLGFLFKGMSCWQQRLTRTSAWCVLGNMEYLQGFTHGSWSFLTHLQDTKPTLKMKGWFSFSGSSKSSNLSCLCILCKDDCGLHGRWPESALCPSCFIEQLRNTQVHTPFPQTQF